MKIHIPELSDIQKAQERIKPFVHRTPVLTSQAINTIAGRNVYFKCENFQKVGAFKYRGATNAVACLKKHRLKAGVATHSSGNHAAALALAAKMQKIKAWIVMPRNAPEVKKQAVKGYGAEIVFCEPTLESRESTLNDVLRKTGAAFIHPFNNFNVVAGQGTAAIEFLEDAPQIDALIAPVGGGGLISGSSITVRGMRPGMKVYAAEPKNADDACRSFHANTLFPSENPSTIADGLLTSLSPMTFQIIRANVDDIITAEETSIIEAMKLIWTRMKIIVEPSAVLPLAILLENPSAIDGNHLGMILTGGNVDFSRVTQLF